MVSDILHFMAGLNECSWNVQGANITFMVDYYINGWNNNTVISFFILFPC